MNRDDYNRLLSGQKDILSMLRSIKRAIGAQGEKEMSAIDDLKKQFSRLQTDFAAQIKAYSDKLAQHDDPAVVEVSTGMASLADQVEQSIAAINPPPAA